MCQFSQLPQLIRILFHNVVGWACHLLWLLIVGKGVFCFATSIVTIWWCNTRHDIWHLFKNGTCVNLAVMLIIGAVINFISETIILVLPIRKSWRLQLNTAKKIRVKSYSSIRATKNTPITSERNGIEYEYSYRYSPYTELKERSIDPPG